jgi:molybdenum cofactor guanylyltransferase
LIGELRARLTGDGVLVVDDTGRDQLLLGVWRTAALRAAVADTTGPTSLRKVFAPLAVRRLRPLVAPGTAPPWTDCDTPAELARARQVAGGASG